MCRNPGWLLLGSAFALGCSGSARVFSESRERLVQGPDDRRDYHELDDELARGRLRESLVALVPNDAVVRAEDGAVSFDAPTWGEAQNLCAGERFAEQPSAAFCSGVLVDWDLVLTAGHCARVLAPDDVSAVFGYFYVAEGELAVTTRDVLPVKELAAEALSPSGETPHYDFAWYRLARRAAPPLAPAPLHVRDPRLIAGERLLTLTTVGGVPFKADRGGSVRDARVPFLDYFLADTDTSHGSSGGGAFDEAGALLGVLARGGIDFVTSEDGCSVTRVVEDGTATEEQFSYAHSALRALCDGDPQASTLCRASCETPCSALEPPAPLPAAFDSEPNAGCALVAPPSPAGMNGNGRAWLVAGALAGTALAARRRRSQAPRLPTRCSVRPD